MRRLTLIVTLLACGLTIFAQEQVSPEEKALLEQLSQDKSFAVINRETDDLATLNAHKQKIYAAYLRKSPGTIKVFKRERAGWEGQYTMTWFTVDQGKVKIVEAYFGDPSGSGELQYVREYAPEEIKLGYLDKDWKFVPLSDDKVPRNKELAIGYRISSEKRMKRF